MLLRSHHGCFCARRRLNNGSLHRIHLSDTWFYRSVPIADHGGTAEARCSGSKRSFHPGRLYEKGTGICAPSARTGAAAWYPSEKVEDEGFKVQRDLIQSSGWSKRRTHSFISGTFRKSAYIPIDQCNDTFYICRLYNCTIGHVCQSARAGCYRSEYCQYQYPWLFQTAFGDQQSE